jgi:predicted O-methyltransferase YrrM
MKKILKKILIKHPPSYRVIKSIYDLFIGRKYKNYNSKNDLKYNEDLLSSLELDVKFIKSILNKYGLNYDDQKLSWHHHLFAGLKKRFEERNTNIDKILEIGTYDGGFTSFLSKIYPDAEIITIDLDDESHAFTSSYGREEEKKLIKFLEIRKNNLDNKNIKFIQMSSLELENNFKYESFDLIWIDGDHLNPQVTIDIFQCLKLIKKNGFICVDDILKDDAILKKGVKKKYISCDSFKTLEYFNNLEYLKTNYLLKRVTKRNFEGKKFISISSLKDLT